MVNQKKREEREAVLQAWVKQQVKKRFNSDWHAGSATWEAVSGDASFRRYFRATQLLDGDLPIPEALYAGASLIAVDAPPDKENNPAFVAVAQALFKEGVVVPDVLAFDFNQGFMLLTDLGNDLLLPQLTADNVDFWYQRAFSELHRIQGCPREAVDHLCPYDAAKLRQEMALFSDWFLAEKLALEPTAQENEMLEEVYQRLVDEAIGQPQVMVHRDFHSRNLMVLSSQRLGVIDFQDAVWGPITYDLVSLLKDCYIRWDRQRVRAWVNLFQQQSTRLGRCEGLSEHAFLKCVDWMGLQRHIKVVGIFSRLFYRDGKEGYLDDIPRTLAYIIEVAQHYPEFQAFENFLMQRVIPRYIEREPMVSDWFK